MQKNGLTNRMFQRNRSDSALELKTPWLSTGGLPQNLMMSPDEQYGFTGVLIDPTPPESVDRAAMK